MPSFPSSAPVGKAELQLGTELSSGFKTVRMESLDECSYGDIK